MWPDHDMPKHKTVHYIWPCLDVGNPTAKIEYFPSGT